MIELKIGHHIYKITGDDKFMDNGHTSIFNRIQKPRCRFSLTKGE